MIDKNGLVRTEKSKKDILEAETASQEWCPSVRGVGSVLVPGGGWGKGDKAVGAGSGGTLHPHSMPAEQLKAWTLGPEWLLESWQCTFYMCDSGPPSPYLENEDNHSTFLIRC